LKMSELLTRCFPRTSGVPHHAKERAGHGSPECQMRFQLRPVRAHQRCVMIL